MTDDRHPMEQPDPGLAARMRYLEDVEACTARWQRLAQRWLAAEDARQLGDKLGELRELIGLAWPLRDDFAARMMLRSLLREARQLRAGP